MKKRKMYKLVDVVNLVHPTPTEKNGEALNLLINDKLKNTQTWEAKLSAVGQVAEGEEDLSQLKADAWDELISTRKIGLMAMLKNLRNIIKDSPKSIPLVCESLKNEKFITNSKVLPFRFSTAYDEISKLSSSKEVRDVLTAINQALEVSLVNVPKFEGETLVVMDVSGSMSGRPSEIASLFGAILAKVNNSDVITFSTSAQYKSYNPMDSVMTIRNSFRYSGGGTNVRSVFQTANKPYENIILLSDFQSWVGYTTPSAEFNNYKNKYNCNPYVYSWDLAGYGTMQFPEQNVFALAGFSDKVFDIIKLLKSDRNALLNEIKSISLD